ncbi:hypothetical protein PC116_g5063 [Phytophthora cactorum]|uniref:Uncharacterized protein n=1 Tax=Phytophthora cactorum TaxID=29920 RepID=A0A8T1LI13_9STRA|nr:hypothetical protein PC114_g2773 [Phytophthora cactorum]KAG2952717.1 hypothetical protein PC117_g2593 [Phytophthora cactorum]KAG3035964.1 hypothetical protein PC120_g523 [Phytophthora cactorum]KAG3039479.1 hypothetical protein PC119_g2132 [Phytophthora cactorum]KAG3189291.1 hypothetical protein C6341_g2319 [Phytophthora cactorum]
MWSDGLCLVSRRQKTTVSCAWSFRQRLFLFAKFKQEEPATITALMPLQPSTHTPQLWA